MKQNYLDLVVNDIKSKLFMYSNNVNNDAIFYASLVWFAWSLYAIFSLLSKDFFLFGSMLSLFYVCIEAYLHPILFSASFMYLMLF